MQPNNAGQQQYLPQMQQFLYRQQAQAGQQFAQPAPAPAPAAAEAGENDQDSVIQYILELTNPSNREQALLELSKKREAFENLAPILWHSFGWLHLIQA